MMRQDFHKYYDKRLGGVIFRWVDFAKLRLIKKELSQIGHKLKILGLGCGTTSTSSNLIKKCIEIFGADVNKELLGMTKWRGVKTFLIDFDKKLSFKSNFFDIVLMRNSIKHTISRNFIINEVKKVLKTEDILLIFTPPYDSINWLIAEKRHNPLTRSKSDHICPFTWESLDFLLKSNFKNINLKQQILD